jgi:PIN domain nuclease of toxin-antitoxin system
VRLLLDTSVFLWLQTEPERLGSQLEQVADPATDLFVSAATAWEIAIKYALGRLPLPEPPDRWMPDRVRALAAVPLPIDHDHALAVAALPPVHRDPVDRLLIAQSRLLGAPLLTADSIFTRYDVQTLFVEP